MLNQHNSNQIVYGGVRMVDSGHTNAIIESYQSKQIRVILTVRHFDFTQPIFEFNSFTGKTTTKQIRELEIALFKHFKRDRINIDIIDIISWHICNCTRIYENQRRTTQILSGFYGPKSFVCFEQWHLLDTIP